MGLHVITGASAGMGRAAAIALAERGESVVAVARGEEALADLAAASPLNIQPVAGDVGASETVDSIVAAVNGRPVVGLVHAAATPVALDPWAELDAEELTEHFRVHVAAPIALTGALLAGGPMKRVVILDSYSATTPRVGWAAYSILKAGVQMAFRAAADELDGVIVARVFPGAVDTPLLQRVLDASPDIEATGFYRELAQTGRVSDVTDIGRSIAELLVDVPDHDFAANDTWHIGHSISIG